MPTNRATNYICIGPVNKLLNTPRLALCNPNGAEVNKHIARMLTNTSRDDQGVRMNGYNSSELWDATFASSYLRHG
ncbi:MAG: hypothetical protein R3C68_01200 [Myxococcota bacterium]